MLEKRQKELDQGHYWKKKNWSETCPEVAYEEAGVREMIYLDWQTWKTFEH